MSLSKKQEASFLDELGFELSADKADGSISIYSQDLSINGKKGGKLSFNNTWFDRGISMTATLNIPEGAFKGTKDFTVEFNCNDLSVELSPTPFSFDIPVELTLRYYGVDVSDYTDKPVFTYLSNDAGQTEEVAYQSLSIGKNYILVGNAQLHHFSRYGFVK